MPGVGLEFYREGGSGAPRGGAGLESCLGPAGGPWGAPRSPGSGPAAGSAPPPPAPPGPPRSPGETGGAAPCAEGGSGRRGRERAGRRPVRGVGLRGRAGGVDRGARLRLLRGRRRRGRRAEPQVGVSRRGGGLGSGLRSAGLRGPAAERRPGPRAARAMEARGGGSGVTSPPGPGPAVPPRAVGVTPAPRGQSHQVTKTRGSQAVPAQDQRRLTGSAPTLRPHPGLWAFPPGPPTAPPAGGMSAGAAPGVAARLGAAGQPVPSGTRAHPRGAGCRVSSPPGSPTSLLPLPAPRAHVVTFKTWMSLVSHLYFGCSFPTTAN